MTRSSADRKWIRVPTLDGFDSRNLTPSAHIVRWDHSSRTLCGLIGDPTTVTDNQPAGKSCETCLRIVVR